MFLNQFVSVLRIYASFLTSNATALSISTNASLLDSPPTTTPLNHFNNPVRYTPVIYRSTRSRIASVFTWSWVATFKDNWQLWPMSVKQILQFPRYAKTSSYYRSAGKSPLLSVSREHLFTFSFEVSKTKTRYIPNMRTWERVGLFWVIQSEIIIQLLSGEAQSVWRVTRELRVPDHAMAFFVLTREVHQWYALNRDLLPY